MKYKDWLKEWIAYYVRHTTKDRTYKKYTQQINRYILPQLGEFDLCELSANVLQKFTVNLFDSGLAPNTINSIISLLKSSLKRAVVLGLATTQFTDAIIRPKVREKQVECLKKDEQRLIEQYISESKRDKLFGIVLSLYTGLRIGELLALLWSDVDFSKGIITVEKSCHDDWNDGKYSKIIDTPKTQSSRRIIPLPKKLLSRLKNLKNRANSNYVVKGKGDFGVEVRSYQRTFENLLIKLNIPRKGFHALRHTFATRALEVGMDVKTLAEILGHSNPMVTLKRYAHSMMEYKAEMMNKVGKLMI